jgi:hypothetical protein
MLAKLYLDFLVRTFSRPPQSNAKESKAKKWTQKDEKEDFFIGALF